MAQVDLTLGVFRFVDDRGNKYYWVCALTTCGVPRDCTIRPWWLRFQLVDRRSSNLLISVTISHSIISTLGHEYSVLISLFRDTTDNNIWLDTGDLVRL